MYLIVRKLLTSIFTVIYTSFKLLYNWNDATQSPGDAALLIRGLQTLHLRMERHSANAQKLAEFLEKHPNVTTVSYPGLPSHPGHEIAKKHMSGYGGMIAFEVKGGLLPTKKFAEVSNLFE